MDPNYKRHASAKYIPIPFTQTAESLLALANESLQIDSSSIYSSSH